MCIAEDFFLAGAWYFHGISSISEISSPKYGSKWNNDNHVEGVNAVNAPEIQQQPDIADLTGDFSLRIPSAELLR
jgi:hypothetical protein